MEVKVIKKTAEEKGANRRSLENDVKRVAAYCRVSTDHEDQIHSYKAQCAYYKDMISSHNDWKLVEVYADEGISGTQVQKRDGFKQMIEDCDNGYIDMIITKSISRFARNTLDTLKYVRNLKEKNIDVFFESEHIHTLSMDGELLLVVLSSVAQQEVENISSNVKKGLKFKMSSGEMVGFPGCLGYDYDPQTKAITINEKEAEIVRYIFKRYVEGKGTYVIAKELNEKRWRTKKGNSWDCGALLKIIKNEKYVGDLLQGKTITIDPITHRRLPNKGEQDQYYVENHHEPIIDRETYNAAQSILELRGKSRNKATPWVREKYSCKYTFSSKLECGFCGGHLTRRMWHAGTDHPKAIWQCIAATKGGKAYCPDSKGIPEELIEQAFIESYRELCGEENTLLQQFMEETHNYINELSDSRKLEEVNRKIRDNENKQRNLIDLRLESKFDTATFDKTKEDLDKELENLLTEKEVLEAREQNKDELAKRIQEFKKTLAQNQVLETFDRSIFEALVEKVIIGEKDEEGNTDPYKITFVYRTGYNKKITLPHNGRRFVYTKGSNSACSEKLQNTENASSKLQNIEVEGSGLSQNTSLGTEAGKVIATSDPDGKEVAKTDTQDQSRQLCCYNGQSETESQFPDSDKL
ncbi:recombinase family protein [Butyrivibrio sp. INlla16]|uniref:recombinase family protein n=1 Tax=Butyrivibrio sp. INlla16 TaxID=1520807 RepID=UPI0008924166|nr:recombinase family protein [Butyrivibrio sp. INlla16]SDB69527.1 Site-specific DNA recombinase [Butyrivibrio sp. INlla16]